MRAAKHSKSARETAPGACWIYANYAYDYGCAVKSPDFIIFKDRQIGVCSSLSSKLPNLNLHSKRKMIICQSRHDVLTICVEIQCGISLFFMGIHTSQALIMMALLHFCNFIRMNTNFSFIFMAVLLLCLWVAH